jgi:small redox-active disulfide protein 2
MEIKVFGLGHVKSILSEEIIRNVLVEEGINAQIETVTGCKEIASYGIFLTPSVLINGEVKCIGRIPTKEEVKGWISKSRKKEAQMNPVNSICRFIENFQSASENKRDDDRDVTYSSEYENKPQESAAHAIPRDGMSDESAKFLIGRCANNTGYKVYGLENKGRYFTAKVLDQKGNMVSELLVDKLNGNVKFIR